MSSSEKKVFETPLTVYQSTLPNVPEDWCLQQHCCENRKPQGLVCCFYEGWSFNSGNYLFTTDTK